MADRGIYGVEVYADGSSYIGAPEELTGHETEYYQLCVCETGWLAISTMYHWVREHPEEVDINEELAQCVIRVGLQPPGYTSEQFWEDYAAGVYEQMTGDEATMYQGCMDNPEYYVPSAEASVGTAR